MPRGSFVNTTTTLDEQQTISRILQQVRDEEEAQERIDQLIERLSETEQIEGDATEWLRDRIRARASQEAIKRHWLEQGGPNSAVGLPKDPMFPLQKVNGHYLVEFRGGDIKVRENGRGLAMNASRQVAVIFEGYGLEIRQEDGDELFGTLSCKVGSTNYMQEFILPEVELGPDDNNRINQPGLILYQGPPTNLNILLSIVEHDEGSRDEVRDETRKRFREVLQKAGEAAAGGALGDAAAQAVHSMRIEASSQGDLFGWLANAASDLITDILGMGHDAYAPVGLTITAAEMENPPPVSNYRCSADPRVLRYTHARTTLCRDDGGDVGQITAVFRVETI